jgi:hypothetical protein
MRPGVATARRAQLRGLKGVEHNVVNATDHEVVFIEVEIR